MPTKDELSNELNETLNTDIEWDRMLEDDLKEFKYLVDGGELFEILIKHYTKKYGKEWVDHQIDEWYPGKFVTKIL